MPRDFPGSFLITIHRHAHSEDLLSAVLDKRTKIAVASEEDGLGVDPGVAYVAPPDRHLLFVDGHLRLSAGARENRARPSIDVMLRSIAVPCAPSAIGVVLSGLLNDGADGLRAIKSRRAAAERSSKILRRRNIPEMPEMAARATVLDHALPAKHIAHTIGQIVRVDPASLPRSTCPAEIQAEVDIALGKRLSISTEDELGTNSNVTCPDCGGCCGICHLKHLHGFDATRVIPLLRTYPLRRKQRKWKKSCGSQCALYGNGHRCSADWPTAPAGQ